jgi:hypothetical protein
MFTVEEFREIIIEGDEDAIEEEDAMQDSDGS